MTDLTHLLTTPTSSSLTSTHPHLHHPAESHISMQSPTVQQTEEQSNESSHSKPSKHHSQEADELDFLCRKLNDVRVRHRQGVDDEEIRLCDVSAEQFAEMVQLVLSSQISDQRKAVIKFRKLLAHEDIHPYLDKIVTSGVVPTFVAMLWRDHEAELQFEAAWVLTNIAAGTSDQTLSVVTNGGVAALVHLLIHSPFKEIKEQSIWCLGNIAGDSVDLRSHVLEQAAIEPLLNLISDEMNEFLASPSYMVQTATCFPSSPSKKSHNYNLSTLRIAIWALSNFCRGNGKSDMDWELLNIALPVLSQVITCCSPPSPHTDDEILMDSLWALSRILRGIHEGIEKVIVEQPVCEKFGELVCYENPDVQVPALRCLINIVSGCDAQTQVVIDAGVLGYLHTLLLHPPTETVRKEACLIISNITAGPKEQIQSVIDANMIPTLNEILRSADFRTKREACWAISNAMLTRDFLQIKTLLDMDVLPPLLALLDPACFTRHGYDERVVLKTLEAIRNILSTGDHAVEHQLPAASTASNGSEMESMGLLNQFEKMQIYAEMKERRDSAYGSSTHLLPRQPFLSYFNQPLNTTRGSFSFTEASKPVTAVDRLRQLTALDSRRSRNGPSRETLDLVQSILDKWFCTE